MAEYNGVMMQYFHWYTPPDGTLWNQLAENASILAETGITAVWLPPAYKGCKGANDVGYCVYDLFDLGEFDQKKSVRTKYGTREEYLKAIKIAQENNICIYADIVLNHKMGADHPEEFKATPYNPQNRNEPVGELQTIKSWTHFTFPGRKGKYSDMKWHWWHFSAADYNAHDDKTNAIYLFEGKEFEKNVDQEKGNFDYLMGCDIDVNNPDVRKELFNWGEWYLKTTGVDGFRFDAVKHVESSFFLDWLNHLRKFCNKKLFAVGEYWSYNINALKHFVKAVDGSMMLFDTGLHSNFRTASRKGKEYDLTKIFDNTLVKDQPQLAVTIVSNHDTQPLQALESVVEAWFKPIAYAIILLRRDGYPCIFAADYYGANYTDFGKDGKEYEITMHSHKWMIDQFLFVRKKYAYGDQYDYFDNHNCIGWTRIDNLNKQGGIAVLISNKNDGKKKMQTGSSNKSYIDLTGHIKNPVVTDEHGWGEFSCRGRSVSVWIPN